MPSVQRYLSGRHNLARTAALVASSVRASTAIERTSAVRAGGGRVLLSGAYTGHEAAQVDVEIVAAGGIPRASVPQFVGVGNGQLAVQDVDIGADEQTFTLTLADLGVPTASAALDVREVRIRAKTPGALGNDLRITVQPQLVRTATAWALLSDWAAGTATQQGPQWDFGGLPLSAAGELDAAGSRIQFGFDPQVYRPYRVFKDGAWRFGVSPELQRSVATGTQVFTVTGGYVITVTDGTTTETYGDTEAPIPQPPVVSFHDLLVALADSALVEVAGVVVADRTIGGQAAIDVPLRTSAWLLALSGVVKLEGVAVPADAPTQAITVRCVNADVAGQERWSVVGDVSGTLAQATTGTPYTSLAALFTVPVIPPSGQGNGTWSFKYAPVTRAAGVGAPSVCVRPFRFGANARPLTVTFVYSRRPPADCKCSDMPTPRVSLECLGLEEGDAMALDPAHLTRLQTLYAWRKDFHASKWAKYYTSAKDLDFADLLTSVFSTCLTELYAEPPAVTAALDEWDDALTGMDTDLADLESTTFANYAGGNLPETLPAGEQVAVAMPGYVGAPDVFMPQQLSVAITDLVRKYQARLDYVRTLAGIVPKSDPSSGDAGGCWVDHGDDYWWVDADGYYLPAFTNQAYISARRNTETGVAYSTKEFGFGLVVACPERLVLGDSLTIRLEQVDTARPYSVGDTALLQTVGAGAAWLTGGVDGTDEQTWRVAASVAGALPDYMVPTDGSAVPAYIQEGITLQLALGGIPYALGDKFTFAVEAGQYRWRKDAGAWSVASDIPATGIAALADGLTATFEPGAAPSFVAADAYSFAVYQPNAASHVKNATASAWGWAGAAASTTVDFGAATAIGMLALARYSLPPGATATVQLSDDGTTWGTAQALDVSGLIALHTFAPGTTARAVRVNVASATGGSIGWLWVGEPLATTYSATTCQPTRRWAVQRGQGVNAAALYSGAGVGWGVEWDINGQLGGYITQTEASALLGLVDWAQQHDEPLIFVPHHLHPQDAALVRPADDAIEVTDAMEYQPNDTGHRKLQARLTLDPLYT
ncbi:discoidin domain-containing protein [Acidovorax sp. Leaf73]|uniref:discoidin domain-containing protein n=1 Tax=Acidovorax sp. Leaf73 TaxID=2876566 RepID=UPI001E495979|nr:discoidin domain-containing protein [Acidovorax sp. Leaf73]